MRVPTPKSIRRQIDDLVSRLVKLGLADDSNHTVPKQTAKAGFEIGFPGMSAISVALKERDYEEIYEELANARAYNVKLRDGTMVQMMYEFRDGALLRHRLAFFPSPRRIVPFPFRFDFDAREEVSAELVHPKCHLTLGQYENCRIPVTAPLTPRWFIDFILRNFYHTAFHQYAEKLPMHGALFETSISPKEQQIIHVLAPAARR